MAGRVSSWSQTVIRGLTYTILTTDDVPRARRFFTEKLGLTTEDDMGDALASSRPVQDHCGP